MNLTQTQKRILTASAALVLVAIVGFKIRLTPEWSVLTGDTRARSQACKQAYLKSPPRAQWMLRRLLSDSSPLVRATAIEAVSRMTTTSLEFREMIATLADDPDIPVQMRALEYLLSPPVEGELWDNVARQRLDDRQTRLQYTDLLRATISAQAGRNASDVIEWALQLLADDDESIMNSLSVLCQHRALLVPHRARLLQALDQSHGSSKEFIVTALTAIDGEMRGYSSLDWSVKEKITAADMPRAATAVDRFTVEAEWAYGIQPNYQVEMHDGELCLYLGEGGGGRMSWRNQGLISVDLGEAFVPFTLSTAGIYRVWIRGWFADKCGNATGISIDGKPLGIYNNSENDAQDHYRRWFWKVTEKSVNLSKGKHTLEIRAMEDGASIDKCVLIPAETSLDPKNLPPAYAAYDLAVPSTISIRTETQTQVPGSEQTVTLWIRRNRPDLSAGTLQLTVAPPFEISGANKSHVLFSKGSPIARSSFVIRVPNDAPGSEVELKASFTVDGKLEAVGHVILGVHFDWLTTGPLLKSDPLCRRLLDRTELGPKDLAQGWQRFPVKGYDRYRRMDFERAYGQSINKYIFLYTEIEIAEQGTYLSMLTLDDSGYVWIDGQHAIGREHQTYGEGHLITKNIALKKGRHRVFARILQSGHHDPSGPNATYRTQNYWLCKWLLRRKRHKVTPQIRGVALDKYLAP